MNTPDLKRVLVATAISSILLAGCPELVPKASNSVIVKNRGGDRANITFISISRISCEEEQKPIGVNRGRLAPGESLKVEDLPDGEYYLYSKQDDSNFPTTARQSLEGGLELVWEVN